MAVCQVCEEESAATEPWTRMSPQGGTLQVCAECSTRFGRWSHDKAPYVTEALRVMGYAAQLGGEAWRSGDLVYYFREALHPKITAWWDAPMAPAPSQYTSFLYRLAGRRVPRRTPRKARVRV